MDEQQAQPREKLVVMLTWEPGKPATETRFQIVSGQDVTLSELSAVFGAAHDNTILAIGASAERARAAAEAQIPAEAKQPN